MMPWVSTNFSFAVICDTICAARFSAVALLVGAPRSESAWDWAVTGDNPVAAVNAIATRETNAFISFLPIKSVRCGKVFLLRLARLGLYPSPFLL
ncbi:MAG: hypothetical protein ACOYLK_14030 [Sphingomonas sp.]